MTEQAIFPLRRSVPSGSARLGEGDIEMSIAAKEIYERVAALEARQCLSVEALGHLDSLWCSIQAEVWYDPASESSQQFAKHLLPHIKALNDELKFHK
jgi:hypothetical protein